MSLNSPLPLQRYVRPLFVTALFALVFHRFWGNAVFFRDSFRLYAPIKYLVAEGWETGRVIGWNPFQYLGMPFAADILTGYFYPLNLIYLALPFEYAHNWFILIHYPLAALFMDLFLRGQGIDSRASLLAGLGFALCGYMTCQHVNMVYLIGPAWAPLGLYFFSRSVRESSVFMALAAGAALAIQVFAGEPQSAALTALLIALMAAGSLWGGTPDQRPGLRLFPFLALGLTALFSALLSAVQLLPTRELLALSIRRSGLDLTESSMFAYHPGAMIDLIWPTPFGVIWPELRFWGLFMLDSPVNNPWSITNYLGLPLMTLAAVGVFRSARPWKKWVGILAVFFLFLSFGHHTPIYGLLYRHVPFFNFFRFSSKYMAWFSGCVAVAAALGFEKALEWNETRPAGLGRGAFIYMAAVSALAVLALWVWPKALREGIGLDPAIDRFLYEYALGHLWKTGAQLVMVNLAAAGVIALMARRKLAVKRGAALFISLLVFDWYLADVTAMPAAPIRIYTFTPKAETYISPEGRPRLGQYRIYREPMNYRFTNPELNQFPLLAAQIAWERSTLIGNFDNLEGFENITGYNAVLLNEGHDLLIEKLTPRIMKLFNTRYVIAPILQAPVQIENVEIVGSDAKDDLIVFKLLDSFPRAYWVGAAKSAGSEAEAMALLNSMDLRRVVVLTTPEVIEPGDGQEPLRPAQITRYDTDEVVIESEADAPGWLVLSDRLYPGWTATVDGRDAPILKANVLCRAVKLDAGKHVVSFRFRPKPLRDGALISVPAWIFLLGLGIISMVRRGKRSPP